MKEMIYKNEAKREILDTGEFFGIKYYIISFGLYPAAYVKIPFNHKCFGLLCEDIPIIVHHGLDYHNSVVILENDKVEEGWWIGWNYAHDGDFALFPSFSYNYLNGKRWKVGEIKQHIMDVCYQLTKMT